MSLFKSAIREPAAWRNQSHYYMVSLPTLPYLCLPFKKKKQENGRERMGRRGRRGKGQERGKRAPVSLAALLHGTALGCCPPHPVPLARPGLFLWLPCNDLLFSFTDFLTIHRLLLLQLWSLNFPSFTCNLKDKDNVFTGADKMPQISSKQGKPSFSLVCWITEVAKSGRSVNLQEEKNSFVVTIKVGGRGPKDIFWSIP